MHIIRIYIHVHCKPANTRASAQAEEYVHPATGTALKVTRTALAVTRIALHATETAPPFIGTSPPAKGSLFT
jgi:hypothetical protein